MTEVMPHPVNIRKRRIMEALKDEAMYNEPLIDNVSQERAVIFEDVTEEVVYDDMLIYEDVIKEAINNETTLDADAVKATNDEEATISVDLDNLTDSVKSASRQVLREKLLTEHKSDFNVMYMKLSLLDNWEESKRNTLEHMVKDLGELESLQDRLDSLLELLANRNLEIDENDYIEFQKKQLEENPIYEPLDELRGQSQPHTPKRLENQTKRVKISATSTPISAKTVKKEIIETFVADDDGLVVIGPNGTTIAKTALAAINWSLSGAALTRKILMEVFDRETLAFHTLTGKPSPAFMDCDKPMKNQLDTLKVADIIHLVMEHTKLTAKEVRNAITTKCADENKMYRQREKKRLNADLMLQQKK